MAFRIIPILIRVKKKFDLNENNLHHSQSVESTHRVKNQKIHMSPDEFELMPHPFGWKVEYWDGMAHLTPREYNIKVKLALKPHEAVSSERIRPVDRRLKGQMIEIFFETFRDSVEFCNSWYRHEIWRLERLDKNDDLDELKLERDRWHARLDNDWKY